MNRDHVIVAMSGGVDSSLVAYMLKEQGYRITGIMLNLWSNPRCKGENSCCTPESQRYARQVADQLGVPFYVIDAKNLFYKEVVHYFLKSQNAGETPNPCWVCNIKVKWKVLLDQLDLLDADWLATGHYARLINQNGSPVRLFQAKDLRKDQSYVLSGLSQSQLSRTLYPLGDLTKTEVREKAQKIDLVTAKKPDSQDLCFLGGQTVDRFLAENLVGLEKQGDIVDRKGEILGTHLGLSRYTIGQRKGIKIPNRFPYYVLDKDIKQNQLIVGKEEELGRDQFSVSYLNWISGNEPKLPMEVAVKIRYKAPKVEASLVKSGQNKVFVKAESVLRDVTPGQIAVFYNNEEVLGCGIISTNKFK
jgi:tRNA-uridine 2-sulfurtransferase